MAINALTLVLLLSAALADAARKPTACQVRLSWASRTVSLSTPPPAATTAAPDERGADDLWTLTLMVDGVKAQQARFSAHAVSSAVAVPRLSLEGHVVPQLSNITLLVGDHRHRVVSRCRLLHACPRCCHPWDFERPCTNTHTAAAAAAAVGDVGGGDRQLQLQSLLLGRSAFPSEEEEEGQEEEGQEERERQTQLLAEYACRRAPLRVNSSALRAAMRLTRAQRLAVIRRLAPQRRQRVRQETQRLLANATAAPQPQIVLLAGGIGVGKSSLAAQLQPFQRFLWISADAFKLVDPLFDVAVLYDDAVLNYMLHADSVAAAEQLLAKAVSLRLNVVFDSTLMWAPFALDTIAMIRDVQWTYKARRGWKSVQDTQFWVQHKLRRQAAPPYRIRMMAVTCSVSIAKTRAVLRSFRSGRRVPLAAVLRSSRLFSRHFAAYAELVDEARLWDNSEHLACPVLVASKRLPGQPLQIVRADLWQEFVDRS